MASAIDNAVSEQTVERNFKAFRPYLEKNIKAIGLIAYYDLFSTENKIRIRQLNKTDPSAATREALDVIETLEEPGKYMHLIQALDDAEYSKLVSVLKGYFVPVDSYHREHIRLSTRHIFTLLKPTNILPHLQAKKVVTENDAETIRKTEMNESRGVAALDLMFILPNRQKDWYRLFLESLIEGNHEDLADLIDPDRTKQIIANREGREDINWPSMLSLQPRHHVEREIAQSDEDSGGPASVNNLDAPKREDKFLTLGSLAEMQSEDQELHGQYSIGERIERLSIRHEMEQLPGELQMDTDQQPRSFPQTKTRDIPKMNSFESLKYDETSVKSVAGPRSPESNIPNVREALLEETNPKRLYERAPPEGSEIRHDISYHPVYDNKPSKTEKVMKDKDLYVSFQEGKKDNIVQSLNYASNLNEPDVVNEDVVDEDISLREYQKELAKPAIKGQNCLIVAPTGSGKTRVALKIIQEHMRQARGRGVAKVIFLVNQVALANQQAVACESQLKKYTTKVISGDTQRSKGECLKDFVDKRDIMVVTVQVLLDALVKKEIDSITKFSLMIFDECHHTHANHPFNQIMSMYMDLKLNEKFDNSALPQIIGLTASVGVGKAKNVDQAVQHIKSLMANLDSEVICTVQNNMKELRSYVNVPDEETCTVPKRSSYVFGDGVTRTMERIEKDMTSSQLVKNLVKADEFEKLLKPPAEKGSAQYTQWLSKLWKETAKLRDQGVRRFLNPCRAHLEYYNNALIIYNDARIDDAMNYLKENMKRWKENAVMQETETRLEIFFQALQALPFHQDSVNPKLEKLKEMILKGCRDEESRGIVFVKTRDLATAIVSWMKETPRLKELNAIKFVGQNMSADKGGMTKVQQDDALKYFRDGKHKIIVATSVAEEGLDISKCNLVIRYDHVTNEIAMVQSRGRGRAENSKYVLVAERGKGMAEKEELNTIRENLMRKAIIQLQNQIITSPKAFTAEMFSLQDEAKLDRELKAIQRKGKRIRTGEFEMRCFKCSEFICMSSDIKKIENAHHVCVDEALKDRVQYVRVTTTFTDDQVEAVGKAICSECGNELCRLIKHKGLEFPELKPEKYLIVDMNGRQDSCKAWKDAPFEAQPLTTADFREMLQKRKDAGEM